MAGYLDIFHRIHALAILAARNSTRTNQFDVFFLVFLHVAVLFTQDLSTLGLEVVIHLSVPLLVALVD